MTDTALVHFDAARQELVLARNVDEVRQIRDKAAALYHYIRQQGASLEMQNQCAEIKLRAERRAGEILAVTEKHRAGRPPENRSHDVTDLPPRLEDLGWVLADLRIFRLWFVNQVIRMEGEKPGIEQSNNDGSSMFRVFRLSDLPSSFIVAQLGRPRVD